MNEREQALDPSQFLWIHRLIIGNDDCLQEMRSCSSNNEYAPVLTDGTERMMSSTNRNVGDDFCDETLYFALLNQHRLVPPLHVE